MVPAPSDNSRPPAVTVIAKPVTIAYEFRLDAETANQLYNDIYRITNDAGISSVSQRGDHFPALFAIYDALADAGCLGDA